MIDKGAEEVCKYILKTKLGNGFDARMMRVIFNFNRYELKIFKYLLLNRIDENRMEEILIDKTESGKKRRRLDLCTVLKVTSKLVGL